jgi:hypothetical protein
MAVELRVIPIGRLQRSFRAHSHCLCKRKDRCKLPIRMGRSRRTLLGQAPSLILEAAIRAGAYSRPILEPMYCVLMTVVVSKGPRPLSTGEFSRSLVALLAGRAAEEHQPVVERIDDAYAGGRAMLAARQGLG